MLKEKLYELNKRISSCTNCFLHKTRYKTVFYKGNIKAKLMIIGEAPGYYEDKKGIPFVGRSGQLLDKILFNIGLKNIYITNVLKCRPPNNREPTIKELIKCGSYLKEQIKLINPIFIVALGRISGKFLLKRTSIVLNQNRNKIFFYKKIPFMITYHPSYLLRYPNTIKLFYKDFQNIKSYLKKM
ncbi:uracil-DNA glycosylase [Candidatus Legionella polyplacis]|uniref:Type-4 uracil-DNA glycosylase n=1 Tax=Candidatus Legionella polyplacis TaxID=2005262 RepID=A0ABZ2H0B3_9GAMM